jgi:hypothetical protein
MYPRAGRADGPHGVARAGSGGSTRRHATIGRLRRAGDQATMTLSIQGSPACTQALAGAARTQTIVEGHGRYPGKPGRGRRFGQGGAGGIPARRAVPVGEQPEATDPFEARGQHLQRKRRGDFGQPADHRTASATGAPGDPWLGCHPIRCGRVPRRDRRGLARPRARRAHGSEQACNVLDLSAGGRARHRAPRMQRRGSPRGHGLLAGRIGSLRSPRRTEARRSRGQTWPPRPDIRSAPISIPEKNG